MSREILVIAAHPDDEILGCGGTMARHVAKGDRVHVAFIADGVLSRQKPAAEAELEISKRRAAASAAAKCLGAEMPRFFDFPDQRLDSVPIMELAQAIERLLKLVPAQIIYTHHAGDLNVDHRQVAKAVLTATRPVPRQGVLAVYGFQVLSSTEWAFGATVGVFQPQRYVDISLWLERKLEALRCYGHEMREFPHPRSYQAVTALAHLTGSVVGVEAAEAFTVFREIER